MKVIYLRDFILPRWRKFYVASAFPLFDDGGVYQGLLEIHRAAKATAHLDRFIIFGSFVTTKAHPNDVDILLVMRDDFVLSDCSEETRKLFDHAEAETEFGASIFWIRPSMLVLDTLEDFILYWQIKRDLGRRGIVEVIG
ncbi:MAG: hypothetical protein QOH70_45 [Blastocatellia bacterium]|jgi:predicted nucleotidyltransferase|nr:hypothetical protein [Blastocatellia bacterium]